MIIPLTASLVTYYTELYYFSHTLETYVTSSVTMRGVYPIVRFTNNNTYVEVNIKGHILTFERENENKLINPYNIDTKPSNHKIRLPTTTEIIKYSLA